MWGLLTDKPFQIAEWAQCQKQDIEIEGFSLVFIVKSGILEYLERYKHSKNGCFIFLLLFFFCFFLFSYMLVCSWIHIFLCLQIGHSPFHPKSRCFILIRNDGTTEDFSYRKCVIEAAYQISHEFGLMVEKELDPRR